MSLQNSRQISDVKVVLKMGSDGAGIINIEKTGTSGLVDTYTITLSNGNKYTFDVTNGNGIKSIEKTGTSGLVDTYTITFDDDTTTTYTITNGNGIESIAKTSTSGLVDTYTITFTDGTTTTYEVTNGEGSSAASLPYDNTQSGLQATNVQNAIDETYDKKANKTDLASISITGSTNNTGSTIKKGTFFYKSRALARASVDIANGATLTQNTNYTLVTAGALNESLTVKTGSLTSSHTINTSYTDLRKSGNVVSLIFYITMTSNVASYHDIATIPSEFRPPKGFYVANYLGDSNKAVGITATGGLQCAGALSSGETWRGQLCWII